MARRKNHPGSIDRRGDTYRLRLCVGGQHFSYNLSDMDRAEVEAFARKEHEKLRQQHDRAGLGLFGPMRFSGLLSRFEDDYLPTLAPNTQESYRKSLRPLKAFFVDGLRDPKTSHP